VETVEVLQRGNRYNLIYEFKGCGNIDIGLLVLDATKQNLSIIKFTQPENPTEILLVKDNETSYGGLAHPKLAWIQGPSYPSDKNIQPIRGKYTARIVVNTVIGEYHIIVFEYEPIPEIKVQQLRQSM
jgi:hypothetical protein